MVSTEKLVKNPLSFLRPVGPGHWAKTWLRFGKNEIFLKFPEKIILGIIKYHFYTMFWPFQRAYGPEYLR